MKHALVVDDNPVNRKMACALLKRLGWTADQAESGPAALSAIAQQGYDCILLDVSMPEMDGEEVCRRVRADNAARSLYIVAYTAHALTSEHQRILANGFDTVLVKPITMTSLQAVLPT